MGLVGAVLRATKLLPILVTSTISVAFLVVPLLVGLRNALRDVDVSLLYHLSLIASLAGAGFVLDDPAQETLAVTAVGRTRMAVIRMLAGLGALVPVWTLQLLLVPQLIVTERHIPVQGLAMEGPILVIWIWAVSVLFSIRFDGQGSSAAVPAALIGCTVLFFLPERIALFENPGAPGFAGSRVRFALLGVVGLAVLAYGLALRKPQVRPGSVRVRPHV